ncbi:hypothetical protein RHGRI_007378 [Rhododendron griersonianum]|uniref:Ubiquitin-like protease family profile domain-containing protein n=1 Tax=Rhododendron griersonianum TaxID=479676 RepID=A0AAV6KYI0_9ERIC|nr:hypothetical protein RHGRI_007378 [Rhododendron griersonianum]
MQPKTELAVPRFLKWDISRLHLEDYQIGNMADEQVNEEELTTTSEEDLIYKIQIEQEEGEEEQEEGEDKDEEEEEEEEEKEEEEEEEEEEIIDQQNEIEQEVIHIEEEEYEEEQVREEKEMQEEEEQDATPLKHVLEEGNARGNEQEEDLVEEGEQEVMHNGQEEEKEEKEKEGQRDATPLEQVVEEERGDSIEKIVKEGDSAEEGDSIEKVLEEGESDDDTEMNDMFHTAEAVHEQFQSTNQSASTFVPETQFSKQARDHQTAVEDDSEFGESQNQVKKVFDKLEEEIVKLKDNCGKLKEDSVIHEAQIRVFENQNSKLERETQLLRLDLNEEQQRRKTVEYEKTKMAREKDAEIALLKQRIKNLTNEKIDIEAEHVVHEVTQQWKKNRQKQSASTIFDSMSDARLHEITQQARETVEKRKEKETASRLSKESTYMRPIVKKIWKFRAEDQFTRSFDSESERQIHELTCKFGMKKTAEQGKNKEVLHEVGESKKRKGSSDVIKGAEEPGQAQESKKRKLLKSGPVFRYLSKEAKKKLTSFWRSTAATDSLWAGSQYETSIYADETIDSYAEILLGKSPKAKCMILSTRWLYLEAKANETARRKMYDDDLNNVLTFDFVIFPIHEDDHWTLFVLKVLEGTWCFYDSMRVKQNQKPIRCKAATNIVMKLFTLCSSLKIFTLQNTKLRIPFVSIKQQKRVTGYIKERWQRLPIEPKVRIEQDCPQQPPGSDCGIIVCKIMKHFVLNEELQSDISDEECNKIRAEILEQFITDEVGSWQSQENEEVEKAEEQDSEDIHRKSEETSSEMKRKRGQSSSKMKGKSGANAYELRPRANVNRATMEEPGTSVTPTKRRQNQGEVQSKSKHNNEKLDAERKQVTYRSNLQAMISWSFVQLMEDLPAMSNYNWSQAILDNLRKSVEAYPTKPKNVAGCVMLLLYWLCEKTNIIEQETKCSTVPRIMKWNLPKLKKKLEGIESLDNFTNVQLLDSTLQRTDREVRVFRTLRNEQNTSNMIQGNSEHNERQCDEDHGSTGKDDEDHGISEHDDSPEHDSEIQHESTEKRSEDHGSEENEEQQCDEDHGSTGKDDEDHGISEHDDSPEHDNEIQHESTEKRSEDHGSEENEEQRTPIYVPYCGSLALVSEDGLEKLDFNQTEEQSEQQSPMYLDSAMTGKSTLNVLSEAAAIEHSWSLVYKRRSKMAGIESQKLIKSTEPEQPSCLFLDSTSTLQGETPAIEKQSDFNLDSALQKENEAANCRSTEPEQPSCLFLDSISTLQGETPAIEKQSGFYLDSTLQKENEAATCKIRELLEQIDEERGLKEEQMEKNEELLKQIEELRALKEDEIKELKSIIEANNEAATSRSRELMEQIDEERGLKEKEMEKNKEQVKQIEELKCEAVKQQEENAAKIAELVVLFDEERGLKEEEMEKNKELVKQMEELKCEAVKK